MNGALLQYGSSVADQLLPKNSLAVTIALEHHCLPLSITRFVPSIYPFLIITTKDEVFWFLTVICLALYAISWVFEYVGRLSYH